MKTDQIKSRIKNGNDIAETLSKYLNKKFGYEFEKVSLEEDKTDMVDFRCKKTGKTAQFKCRENKSDIIFEARRFYVRNNSVNTIDGRDCRCKAELYICLSSDRKRIIAARTDSVKEIVQKEIERTNCTQENIYDLINSANASKNKSLKLTDSPKKIQTWFKIDEGNDTEEYYKLLVFIPYEAISNAVRLEISKSVNLLDEGTW